MQLRGVSSWSVVVFFLLLPAGLHGLLLNGTGQLLKPQAVIVFGDSVVDPGNNNVLATLSRSNFPPYGMNYPDGKATGRFSNGMIPNDLIVAGLGIKETLPAYLDPNLRPNELLTGVSFASGASGFDPLTALAANSLSNDAQLSLFREYKRRVKEIAGDTQGGSIVETSLYMICSGSNDLVNTYFSGPRLAQYSLPAYISFMVNAASDFIKELYNEGGRRIAVLGLPPLGCLPGDRSRFGGLNRDCFEPLNSAARNFNDALQAETVNLTSILPGSKIVYVDIFSPLFELILQPVQHGFEEATRGCCGTGTVEVAMLCNSLLVTTCKDPSKYVFWDGYHPTETAYKILIDGVFRKYIPSFLA